MKFLIITEQKNNYFYPYIQSENIDVKKVYNLNNHYDNFKMKLLRKFGKNHSKYITSNLIGNMYDMIVYFDISCNYRSMKYLKGKNKDVRLFLWNIVDDFINRLKLECIDVNMEYVKSCFDKVYSFDKDDCIKYGLEYFPPLYTSQLKLRKIKFNNDIVFLGAEKGRFDTLNSTFELFGKYKQNYHIYKQGEQKISSVGLKTSNVRISYDKYLEWVDDSKCILDIPQKGQVGFTIRVLESLFLKKKLVTTYSGIQNYDFYNPDNIFIIGIDNNNSIDEFMSIPYQDVDENIISYYDCEKWLNNMIENIIIPRGI